MLTSWIHQIGCLKDRCTFTPTLTICTLWVLPTYILLPYNPYGIASYRTIARSHAVRPRQWCPKCIYINHKDRVMTNEQDNNLFPLGIKRPRVYNFYFNEHAFSAKEGAFTVVRNFWSTRGTWWRKSSLLTKRLLYKAFSVIAPWCRRERGGGGMW